MANAGRGGTFRNASKAFIQISRFAHRIRPALLIACSMRCASRASCVLKIVFATLGCVRPLPPEGIHGQTFYRVAGEEAIPTSVRTGGLARSNSHPYVRFTSAI